MADESHPIERALAGRAGRYFIRFEDGSEGELTYREVRPDVIAIDHTYVPHQFRARGHAERLVLTAIANARAEGKRIVPLCSYVAAQFRRHPDWSDLLADRR